MKAALIVLGLLGLSGSVAPGPRPGGGGFAPPRTYSDYSEWGFGPPRTYTEYGPNVERPGFCPRRPQESLCDTNFCTQVKPLDPVVVNLGIVIVKYS